ncbi:MAG: hypothetical protein K1X94_23380, partial [Sandaracinaceae bacterium]|nr:hypothetical protein [Sandaracinaceae bacterium]
MTDDSDTHRLEVREQAAASSPAASGAAATSPAATVEPDPLRALLHEWFVTYNPLPLASAALVLGGLWVASRELATRGLWGALGVSATAELYALALIASAWALRTRGHRRAAVMLGLLAALYQCDVTLHVETCAYLGTIGQLAALAWLGLFALKLELLARALELELSPSARWIPTLGAAVIALLPQSYAWLWMHERGELVGGAVFVVATLALSTSRGVRAREGFDVRGRRSLRGVQALFAAAALGHVAYACSAFHAPATALVSGLVLASLRVVHRESTVWLVALATTALVAWLEPAMAPITALMAAATLALHALRVRLPLPDAERAITGPSYRGAPLEELVGSEITELAARPILFARASSDAVWRLGLGALTLAHLGLNGWAAETLLSPHGLILDGALALACVGFWARSRRVGALSPLGVSALHLAIVEGFLV